MQCKCGYNDIRALAIDHVNGGGNKHRTQLGRRGGGEFYRWLVMNGYPEGYQVLCMCCQFIKKIENQEHTPLIN